MWVAFLRGMNLGGRRITNDALQQAFVDLGYANVGTYRASGNVLLRDPRGEPLGDLRTRIEEGLERILGYPVPTVLRTHDRVAELARARPWPDDVLATTAGKVQAMLVADAPSEAVRAEVLTLSTADDRLAFDGQDLFWLPKVGISTSELDLGRLDRLLGLVTVRTQGTLAGIGKKGFA